jgi:catechol 2,3-dioxygenase-like lactoylglutathione lyase family enzyme
MLDHIGVSVSDFATSRDFYAHALAALGLQKLMEYEDPDGRPQAGFGAGGKPFFWIGGSDRPRGGTHIAFEAESRAEVEEFYKAAIEAGGRDNGGPGLRPHYHENYYGAFVLDPDGNNIEAVCHHAPAR